MAGSGLSVIDLRRDGVVQNDAEGSRQADVERSDNGLEPRRWVPHGLQGNDDAQEKNHEPIGRVGSLSRGRRREEPSNGH